MSEHLPAVGMIVFIEEDGHYFRRDNASNIGRVIAVPDTELEDIVEVTIKTLFRETMQPKAALTFVTDSATRIAFKQAEQALNNLQVVCNPIEVKS